MLTTHRGGPAQERTRRSRPQCPGVGPAWHQSRFLLPAIEASLTSRGRASSVCGSAQIACAHGACFPSCLFLLGGFGKRLCHLLFLRLWSQIHPLLAHSTCGQGDSSVRSASHHRTARSPCLSPRLWSIGTKAWMTLTMPNRTRYIVAASWRSSTSATTAAATNSHCARMRKPMRAALFRFTIPPRRLVRSTPFAR